MTDYEMMKYLFDKTNAFYVEGKSSDEPEIIIPSYKEYLVFYFNEDESVDFCASGEDGDWDELLEELQNDPNYIIHRKD